LHTWLWVLQKSLEFLEHRSPKLFVLIQKHFVWQRLGNSSSCCYHAKYICSFRHKDSKYGSIIIADPCQHLNYIHFKINVSNVSNSNVERSKKSFPYTNKGMIGTAIKNKVFSQLALPYSTLIDAISFSICFPGEAHFLFDIFAVCYTRHNAI